MERTNNRQEGTTANELYLHALRYYEGNGVARNEKTALKWFSMSAQQGYSPAQIELGDFYCHGLVVKQNLGKAIELYKKAAGLGEKRAFPDSDTLMPMVWKTIRNLPSGTGRRQGKENGSRVTEWGHSIGTVKA